MKQLDICYNNHGGNEQSSAAHYAAKRTAKTVRAEIVKLVAANKQGLTCWEIENILNLPHQTVSARCSELKRDGKLIATGQTRKTNTGCSAAVLVFAENAGVL